MHDDAHDHAHDDAHVHDHVHGPTLVPRRDALRRFGLVLGSAAAAPALLAACSSTGTSAAGTAAPGAPRGTQAPSLKRPDTPDEVLAALREGNARFVSDTPLHPNQGQELRDATAHTQIPFAAVLGCADSRAEPALLFDQGIGDLFVVRNAGNLAEPTGVASLAYAVEVLGVDVIVVLGHGNCGAVKATVAASDGTSEPSEFAVLTDAIQPAVKAAKASGAGPGKDEVAAAAITENVKLQASRLPEMSAILRGALDAGHLKIATAVYDVGTGRATLL